MKPTFFPWDNILTHILHVYLGSTSTSLTEEKHVVKTCRTQEYTTSGCCIDEIHKTSCVCAGDVVIFGEKTDRCVMRVCVRVCAYSILGARIVLNGSCVCVRACIKLLTTDEPVAVVPMYVPISYCCCCCCCCLHIKRRSGLYSVPSNIRAGPTDADAFRGHRLTTQKGYTYQKEIKGPRKVSTHAII